MSQSKTAASLRVDVIKSFLKYTIANSPDKIVALPDFGSQYDFEIAANLSGAEVLAVIEDALINLSTVISNDASNGIVSVEDELPETYVTLELSLDVLPTLYVNFLDAKGSKFFVTYPSKSIAVSSVFEVGFNVQEISNGVNPAPSGRCPCKATRTSGVVEGASNETQTAFSQNIRYEEQLKDMQAAPALQGVTKDVRAETAGQVYVLTQTLIKK